MRDLVDKLAKQKGVLYVKGGLYESFEVKQKYTHNKIELPDKYEILIIPCQQERNQKYS